MYNITVLYLPTSPTYCCYTTLRNIVCSSKGLTGQDYTEYAQKLMPYLSQDQEARALLSSILVLRLMAVIIATSYWCSRCCHDPFLLLLVTWPIWSSAWLTHQTDCRRVSLMMLTTNAGRDLRACLKEREDILNICCNNWTWTRLVVQLLCFRLCNNGPNVLSLRVSLCT